MRKYISILAISLLLGCAAAEIFSDQDDSVNFKSYKTFAWLPTGNFSYGDGFDNQIIESNIKNNASEFLKLAGLSLDTSAPDILFEYHIELKNKTKVEQQPVYSSVYNYGGFNRYNPYWRYNNLAAPYVVGYKNVTVPYEEGTLLISAIDRVSNRLIWRGWSVSTVDDNTSYEQEIKKDISRILLKFPLQAETKKK
jgi:hypothetical protein